MQPQGSFSPRLVHCAGLLVSNAASFVVLHTTTWLAALALSPVLRPWTDPIAALLVGLPSRHMVAHNSPASLAIATALMLQPCAVVMTYVVLRLSSRWGYPAWLASPAALAYMSIVEWRLGEGWLIPDALPGVGGRAPLWIHAGNQLQALAMLTTIPTVVVLSWCLSRARVGPKR